MTTLQELKEQYLTCMPLFIALGDEVRLAIIAALTEEALKNAPEAGPIDFALHGLNVNAITKHVGISRPAVSHHLKILREAGLIGVRREGTANYYFLTLRSCNRILMGLGSRLNGFLV